MAATYRFHQIDVFSADALGGNPVAVVHGADGLSDDEMAAFARWTNLSETTFLLTPTDATADWRLRIFTPDGELPFAGHPTLGSAHAWREAGGVARDASRWVQECAIGLVELREIDGRLAFAAPPLRKSGPLDATDLQETIDGLGIRPDQVIDAAWVDNGPGFRGLLLDSPATVLALDPDLTELPDNVGVIARYNDPAAAGGDVEVRAFCSPGIGEDPVTGSLNAGFAVWLAGRVLPEHYIARQGTALGRSGRVHVSTDSSGQLWIAGDAVTTITGSLRL